jgi:hypothetical protein
MRAATGTCTNRDRTENTAFCWVAAVRTCQPTHCSCVLLLCTVPGTCTVLYMYLMFVLTGAVHPLPLAVHPRHSLSTLCHSLSTLCHSLSTLCHSLPPSATRCHPLPLAVHPLPLAVHPLPFAVHPLPLQVTISRFMYMYMYLVHCTFSVLPIKCWIVCWFRKGNSSLEQRVTRRVSHNRLTRKRTRLMLHNRLTPRQCSCRTKASTMQQGSCCTKANTARSERLGFAQRLTRLDRVAQQANTPRTSRTTG